MQIRIERISYHTLVDAHAAMVDQRVLSPFVEMGWGEYKEEIVVAADRKTSAEGAIELLEK